MAFSFNQVQIPDAQNQQTQIVEDSADQLNKLELEYLLSTLKNIDLKGYQIEMFYNLALKLQNQYLKKNK